MRPFIQGPEQRCPKIELPEKGETMSPLKKILSLSLGLVVLATVLVVISTGTVGAQSLHLNGLVASPPPPSVPVSVVNTPLPVQGTVMANITNTAVPVTGTVAIGSLPAISLNNTSTSPLFVRDVDNPAQNPVFGSCDLINVPGGGFQSCNISFVTSTEYFTSVPAGYRLVIESAAGELDLPTGTIPLEFEVRTSLHAGNPVASYTDVILDPRLVGAANPFTDLYKVSQQTRIYEDSGVTVVLDTLTNVPASGQYTAFFTVTGYLVKSQ
jgi:hypothetical protein